MSGGAFFKITFASLRQLQLPAGDADAEGRKRVREAPASLQLPPAREALHCDSLLVSREYSLQTKAQEVGRGEEMRREKRERGHCISFLDVYSDL